MLICTVYYDHSEDYFAFSKQLKAIFFYLRQLAICYIHKNYFYYKKDFLTTIRDLQNISQYS